MTFFTELRPDTFTLNNFLAGRGSASTSPPRRTTGSRRIAGRSASFRRRRKGNRKLSTRKRCSTCSRSTSHPLLLATNWWINYSNISLFSRWRRESSNLKRSSRLPPPPTSHLSHLFKGTSRRRASSRRAASPGQTARRTARTASSRAMPTRSSLRSV